MHYFTATVTGRNCAAQLVDGTVGRDLAILMDTADDGVGAGQGRVGADRALEIAGDFVQHLAGEFLFLDVDGEFAGQQSYGAFQFAQDRRRHFGETRRDLELVLELESYHVDGPRK